MIYLTAAVAFVVCSSHARVLAHKSNRTQSRANNNNLSYAVRTEVHEDSPRLSEYYYTLTYQLVYVCGAFVQCARGFVVCVCVFCGIVRTGEKVTRHSLLSVD